MALGTKLEHAAKDMGLKATESGEKCTGVSTLLATNKEALDAMIVNIGQAAQMSLASAKNVLELEERTRRIDKIVDAIVMVTVQTRMLAVNGNVEAARAGEFGRGFSAVAGDIRSLATKAAKMPIASRTWSRASRDRSRKSSRTLRARASRRRKKLSAPRSRPQTWNAWP